MAKQREKLTEDKLREIKSDLLERVTDQQKKWGAPVPDVAAAEAFIAPILRKTEVDHEEDRIKDLFRVEPEVKPKEEITAPLQETVPGVKDTFTSSYSGTYDWNLKTDKVTPYRGSWKPKRKRKEDAETAAARHRIRFLKNMPEWKAKLEAVFFAPIPGTAREQRIREILDDSNRLWPDWRKPRPKPIFSR